MSNKIVCAECVNKQEEIYRLREENKRLKAKLRLQERNITEGYFGSSTPSSKKPVKKNTNNSDKEKNKGGGVVGDKELPGVLVVDRYAGYNKTVRFKDIKIAN